MALRFILGRSGTGKTQTCISEITQNSKNNNALIYIVPEQFSLQSEKNLILSSETKTLIKIQVLSFKRLAYHLFSELGGINKKILEDNGKNMLLRKITAQLNNKFLYFKNSSDKQGFIDNLNQTISEFFQYSVTLEKLDNAIEKYKDKENLCFKLKDLRLIYSSYINYIENEYISTDETLDILAEKIEQSSFIDNCEIWIDGFTGFTPQEYNVINKLFKKVKNITVALSINDNKIQYKNLSIYDAFFEQKNTINKLTSIAVQNNVAIEKPNYLKINYRFKNNSELAFLEKYYLYNYPNNKKILYEKDTKSIYVTAAQNKYMEISDISKKIQHLVKDNDYRYNDIAVILGNEDYRMPIKSIFNQYNIPYFMDSKKDIMSHPLTELIRSSLEIIISNWSYESVFRFLKTGLVPFKEDDVNLLENYVLAYGIKGFRWKLEHWSYGFDETTEFEENHINSLKDKLTEILQPISEFTRNKKYTITEISTKVFNFILSLNVIDTLNIWIDGLNDNDALKKEHTQVWKMVTEIFDKMVEILGNEKVTIPEYSKILNAGFSNAKIGIIPPSQDEVIIGDMKRTRLPNIKALFITGVNDGNIPVYRDETGIFSDTEKEAMFSAGVELSPDTKRKIVQDIYLIYSALTKASDKLYLSYYLSELNGTPKRPSSVILKIKSIYANLSTQLIDNNSETYADDFIAAAPAMEKLTKALSEFADTEKEISSLYKDVYNWFRENEVFYSKLQLIKKGIMETNPKDYLLKNSSKKIYSKNIKTTVSRLEKFAKCPFSFFAEYGLKAKERKVYKINAPDMGSLFHNVIEDFSITLKENNINWRELDKNETDKIIDSSVDKIVSKMSTDILLSTSKYKYMVKRVKRIVKRCVWALSQHIKQGLFEPLDYEVGFGIREKLPPIVIELNDNSKIILTGKIDRIDILESNGKSYVKILDYKSYDKLYSLQDVYYGLQLQLILYLDAFIKNGRKIIENELLPGGMFYFKIDDPLIKIEKNITDEKLKQEILKTFNINGLVLNDSAVLSAIDKETDLTKEKLSIRNIKTIKSSTTLANLEQFDALRKYVNKVIKDIGNEMLSGNIKIMPYKQSNKTGCDYCLYSTICNFEIINKYRILKPLKNPWQDIAKKL